MIQVKRELSKEKSPKTLEEVVKEQSQEIANLKQALDDVILNGGAS